MAADVPTTLSAKATFEHKTKLPANAAELVPFREVIAKALTPDGYQGRLADLEKTTGMVEVVVKSGRAVSDKGAIDHAAWIPMEALGAGASEGDTFTYHACTDRSDLVWTLAFADHRWNVESYSARFVKACFSS